MYRFVQLVRQSRGLAFASLLAAVFLAITSASLRAQTQSTNATVNTPASTTANTAAAPTTSSDPSYQLDTGDKVHLTVFGEPDLSGDYDVDGSGYLRLPLIGQIHAAGLTLVQVEDRLQRKLASGYLKDPKVSAVIINYRPFYIIGEVNKPGEYPYASGMNVLTAVALAGGFTYRADDSDVYIRHKGSTDEVSEPADQTTRIKPGDIIRVAERFF